MGTVVAVLASMAALAFTLMPGLSPDPHTGLTASLKIQLIEAGVTLGDYHMRFHPEEVKADTAQRVFGERGDVVYVQAAVQGKKHGEVKLYPVVYDWTSKHPASTVATGASDAFNPGTPNDQWITPVWVNNAALKDYFVRMTLEDRGTILAFVDTPRIKAPPLKLPALKK